jgi:hypothetical protein
MVPKMVRSADEAFVLALLGLVELEALAVVVLVELLELPEVLDPGELV